jgi:hypothetical protein
LSYVEHHFTKNVQGKSEEGDKGKRDKRDKKGKLTIYIASLLSELENDEKWANREIHEVPKRNNQSSVGDATILHDDDDEASSYEGKKPHSQLDC